MRWLSGNIFLIDEGVFQVNLAWECYTKLILLKGEEPGETGKSMWIQVDCEGKNHE